MRRFTSLLLLLVLLASFASAQKKKRVAILDFDYGTVRTDVAAIFGSDQDVGKGIADMLVDRLVNDGTYSVIERKALDKILAEQNFSNSDRADPTSAAKIGKLLEHHCWRRRRGYCRPPLWLRRCRCEQERSQSSGPDHGPFGHGEYR